MVGVVVVVVVVVLVIVAVLVDGGSYTGTLGRVYLPDLRGFMTVFCIMSTSIVPSVASRTGIIFMASTHAPTGPPEGVVRGMAPARRLRLRAKP